MCFMATSGKDELLEPRSFLPLQWAFLGLSAGYGAGLIAILVMLFARAGFSLSPRYAWVNLAAVTMAVSHPLFLTWDLPLSFTPFPLCHRPDSMCFILYSGRFSDFRGSGCWLCHGVALSRSSGLGSSRLCHGSVRAGCFLVASSKCSLSVALLWGPGSGLALSEEGKRVTYCPLILFRRREGRRASPPVSLPPFLSALFFFL